MHLHGFGGKSKTEIFEVSTDYFPNHVTHAHPPKIPTYQTHHLEFRNPSTTTSPPPSPSPPQPQPIRKMGRLHSNGKGISASAIPYSRTPPQWLKTTPQQVVDNICKLAKKGATPSQIGVVLRDSHGIAQVKVVTGKKGRWNWR